MANKFLALDEFKRLAAVPATAPADAAIRKSMVAESVTPIEGTNRSMRFCISTAGVDRDNDTVDAKGWLLDNYKRNPVVLWAHDYDELPVGKATSIGVEGGRLIADAEFADHPFADTVFRLLKGGFLNATSVGFRPATYKMNEARGGLDFETQELLEFSIVPVPANPEALIEARAAGIDISPLKGWADAVLKGLVVAKVPPQAKSAADDMAVVDIMDPADPDPVRWNPTLSKAFDVDGEPLEASRLEYTWVSRFLETPVKDLFETSIHISSPRMGSFLTALEDSLTPYKAVSVRNLTVNSSKEVPPVYETLQLNSKLSRSFLVDGLRFLTGPAKMVVKVEPSWAGLSLTVYAASGARDHVVNFIADTSTKAKTYKFLKGEAFALSGEFLTRGEADWTDLFLAPVNLEPLKRCAALMNEQGANMDSRGIILMGPPGTGKTLTGRALMSEAKDATYIWVSARDFYRGGSYGTISMAFDLAAENAPSIVLFEDVDGWIGEHTDLLKTELDGLKQRKGVVTILTTNFPEYLPEALIDRPGRFHDVLQLDLPTEIIRRAMLAAWAPDADAESLDQLAKDTLNLSGAHIRELVRFAEVLRAQDGTPLGQALTVALEKVKQQRELIDATRSDRRTRRRAVKSFRTASSKGGTGSCDRCGAEGHLAAGVCNPCAEALTPWSEEALVARTAQFVKDAVASVEKRGRVLSGANEARIRRANEILGEVLAQLEAAPTEGDDAKPIVEGDKTIPTHEGPLVCHMCDGMGSNVACNLCGLMTCGEHLGPGGQCFGCTPPKSAKDETDVHVMDVVDPVTADGAVAVMDLEVEESLLDLDAAKDGEEADEINPEDLREALQAAVAEVLSSLVQQGVTTAVNRALGRVD